jgi:hypothetical protein
VDKAGQALHARCENRGGGCESAHAENHGWTVFSINRTTLAVAIPAATHKAYECGRQKHRRHADRRQFFSSELRMRLECDGIDFLLRHKKQNLVAALVAWSEVSQKAVDAPLCNDCYFNFRDVLIERADEMRLMSANVASNAKVGSSRRASNKVARA